MDPTLREEYLSFAEQALHYFQREHEAVLDHPLDVAAAWRGSELREDDWRVDLEAAAIREVEEAYRQAQARGIPMTRLSRVGFPLPNLQVSIASWRRELQEGRGFLLLRGLPVDAWGEEKSSYIFWALGLHLGRPGAQNPQGDLLGHVRSTGEDASNPFVRRYRTAANIDYHCDLADVVGLMCLQTAKSGGASRIVSSVSVFNELVRRRPDLATRLFEPLLLDRRDEGGQGPGYFPVYPCRYAGGQLRTFYHSDYFRSVERHPDAPRFTPPERELFDVYESIAESTDLRLDMELQRGDIQLVSNHFLLHARTRYADDPRPERKRHLLRLWLSL